MSCEHTLSYSLCYFRYIVVYHYDHDIVIIVVDHYVPKVVRNLSRFKTSYHFLPRGKKWQEIEIIPLDGIQLVIRSIGNILTVGARSDRGRREGTSPNPSPVYEQITIDVEAVGDGNGLFSRNIRRAAKHEISVSMNGMIVTGRIFPIAIKDVGERGVVALEENFIMNKPPRDKRIKC